MVGNKVKVKPLVSIIVISYNGLKWLEKCFSSITKTKYSNLEIIFVDNGSENGVDAEYIKRNFSEDKRIKTFYLKKNRGWAGGNNEGMKRATGKYLVFLSNDLKIENDWIDKLLKVANLGKNIGIVQANVHRLDDKKAIDSGMNYLDRFGYAYGFRPVTKPSPVFFAEGMAFLMKRETVDEIGGLDEYFFMEYDDMDLCWRARMAGYEVYFAPDAVVYHAGGGTVGAHYFERRSSNVTQYLRNHLVCLIKHYELKNLLVTLPATFLIEFCKIPFFLLTGNFSFAKASTAGFFQFFRDLPIVLEKRKEVQKLRRVDDEKIMRLMVPFSPKWLFGFLSMESKKKRLIIDEKLPLRNLYHGKKS